MTATTSRSRDVRRVRILNNVTLGWNVVEFVVALLAGLAASSIALLGFALDSAVEVSTSLVIVWLLAAERRGACSQRSDRRATQAISLCFVVLAAWVGFEALSRIANTEAPDASTVGIVLTAASAVAMPVLARAKRRAGQRMASQAVVSESRQTELCAYLSIGVLAGLAANAAFGWWWADPVAALGVAVVAAVEARRTWTAPSLQDACGCP